MRHAAPPPAGPARPDSIGAWRQPVEFEVQHTAKGVTSGPGDAAGGIAETLGLAGCGSRSASRPDRATTCRRRVRARYRCPTPSYRRGTRRVARQRETAFLTDAPVWVDTRNTATTEFPVPLYAAGVPGQGGCVPVMHHRCSSCAPRGRSRSRCVRRHTRTRAMHPGNEHAARVVMHPHTASSREGTNQRVEKRINALRVASSMTVFSTRNRPGRGWFPIETEAIFQWNPPPSTPPCFGAVRTRRDQVHGHIQRAAPGGWREAQMPRLTQPGQNVSGSQDHQARASRHAMRIATLHIRYIERPAR